MTELTCRMRVKKTEEDEDGGADGVDLFPESALVPIRSYPDVGIELRTKWAQELMKSFATSSTSTTTTTNNPHGLQIRPLDFIAMLDGSVKVLTAASAATGPSRNNPGRKAGYPARFQIPPRTLWGLDEAQRVKRAEMFAMASLLYELLSGTQIFEGLSDEEVQERFSKGEFPPDAASLPYSLVIFSGWSEEFAEEMAKRVEKPDVSFIQAAKDHAKAHPILTGIQVAGLTLSAVSMFAVPVLGWVGFTATGPAAGSAAAAWQASIGVVRAGSLFSWCQSAAMSGSALGTIKLAGVAGAALTKVLDIPGLLETFQKVYRTEPAPRAIP